MFGDAIDPARLLHHRWRDDVTTIGELPADEVDEIVGRPLGLALPFAVNRALVDGSYDLVVSVGQVVPHEVAGFGGYTKHVSIGLGGARDDPAQPLLQRRLRDRADDGADRRAGPAAARPRLRSLPRAAMPGAVRAHRCRSAPRRTGPARRLRRRRRHPLVGRRRVPRGGRAVGRGQHRDASTTPFRRCVAYLDPLEYRSTWLGNKAIYRTRLAMADGGELFVVAPGVSRFGEDPLVDALIRRHGYHGREAALQAMAADPELAANLAAVAHLIHGSTEGRFTVTYAPGPELSRADIEGVGFRYLPLDEALERFPARDDASTYLRTRASGCGGSEGRPLHRGVRARPRPVPRRRRAADRQPARAHRRAALRRSRGAARPARPALRHDRPLRRADALLAGRAARARRARRTSGEVDDRAVWQLLADNVHLFALTPTGLWLRETLATVFGIEERLDSASAETIYARVEEQLASPAFAPRALLDRFRVECLSTTDAAGSSLAEHRALAESSRVRIRPTFRPDAVVALDAPGWRDALSELEAAADREIGDYAAFVDGARRAPRRVQGARRDGDRSRGDERRHDAARRARGVRAVRSGARGQRLRTPTRGGSRRTC